MDQVDGGHHSGSDGHVRPGCELGTDTGMAVVRGIGPQEDLPVFHVG